MGRRSAGVPIDPSPCQRSTMLSESSARPTDQTPVPRIPHLVRDAARSIGGGHERPGRVTYANGNWGFQYYMEKEGVRTIDLDRDVLERGDALILLNNNTNPRFNPKDSTYLIDEYKHPGGRWLYTNSTNVGAGFYSSAIGPIPYAFAWGLPDEYRVWRVTRSFRLVPADLGDRESRPPPGSQFKQEHR